MNPDVPAVRSPTVTHPATTPPSSLAACARWITELDWGWRDELVARAVGEGDRSDHVAGVEVEIGHRAVARGERQLLGRRVGEEPLGDLVVVAHVHGHALGAGGDPDERVGAGQRAAELTAVVRAEARRGLRVRTAARARGQAEQTQGDDDADPAAPAEPGASWSLTRRTNGGGTVRGQA